MDEDFEFGPIGNGWLPYIVSASQEAEAKKLMTEMGMTEQDAYRQVLSPGDYSLIYGEEDYPPGKGQS